MPFQLRSLTDWARAHFLRKPQVKRRFVLTLIREKLPAPQGSTIALNDLVMNLEKLLERLFLFLRTGSSFSSAMNHGRVHVLRI
jgi:hypothetical protein